jgi:hypothetical protein
VLSDHERARLDEIQDQLLAEDPRFVQVFEASVSRPRSNFPGDAVLRRGRQAMPWFTVAVALVLLMAGSVGGAALLAMLGVALWIARR